MPRPRCNPPEAHPLHHAAPPARPSQRISPATFLAAVLTALAMLVATTAPGHAAEAEDPAPSESTDQPDDEGVPPTEVCDDLQVLTSITGAFTEVDVGDEISQDGVTLTVTETNEEGAALAVDFTTTTPVDLVELKAATDAYEFEGDELESGSIDADNDQAISRIVFCFDEGTDTVDGDDGEETDEVNSPQPGDDETDQPGDDETDQPDDGETDQPGDDETDQPGDDETDQPGDGETDQPDDGETDQPDDDEATVGAGDQDATDGTNTDDDAATDETDTAAADDETRVLSSALERDDSPTAATDAAAAANGSEQLPETGFAAHTAAAVALALLAVGAALLRRTRTVTA